MRRTVNPLSRGCVGSNPSPATIQPSDFVMKSDGFFALSRFYAQNIPKQNTRSCLTLILTLYPRKRSVRDSHKIDALTVVGLKGFDVLPHAVGTLFFHARRGVRIGAEREGRSGMTEIFLHGLDVVPGAEAVHRKGMPLRYNYDKPEKPRISRVFGYQARFFILFQPEKSSREVVIS